MKIIAIGAVTAGGKTSVVTELSKKLKNAALPSSDYVLDGIKTVTELVDEVLKIIHEL